MDGGIYVKSYQMIEKGPGIAQGIRDFGKSISSQTIAAAIIASVFGCTGPILVCMRAATDAGFSNAEVVSWVWSVYVFGGLLGIFLSLRYKMPIAGAWSIPGATMLSSSLQGFTFAEASGAFLIAGIIVLLLGVTGAIGKVVKYLPIPIVMGMIGGCMFRFGTGIITNTEASPILGLAAIGGYFIVPRIIKRCPPALSALICGVIALIATNQMGIGEITLEYAGPMLVKPEFNPASILAVSVPLAALVVGAENAQAMGVLMGQGYQVPCNAMTVFSGIGGIITSFFGGANANIAGPMTAICAGEDAGPNLEKRYTSAVLNGVCFTLCGLLMGYILAFVNLIPTALVNVISGLAMIGVLMGAFQDAFQTGLCRYGAFMALVIGASGITIFSIGSAFWALVGGVAVSLIAERQDFAKLIHAKQDGDEGTDSKAIATELSSD